jgi:hypothetical protein
MDFRDDYLIWWLDPPAINAIFSCWEQDEKIVGVLPKYIRDELNSLRGRDGRGRLWVADSIRKEIRDQVEEGQEIRVDFPEKDNMDSEWIKLGSHGGIVFKWAWIGTISTFPGFVTDFKLRRIPR